MEMENNLQKGWIEVVIKELELNFFKGVNVGAKGTDGEYMFIPSGANFPSGIKLDKVKWISEDELAKIPQDKILQDEDILFNSGGVGTLGRSSYFLNQKGATVCDSFIIVIRDYLKQMNMRYLFYWFQSAKADELIKANTKGTTGITSIKSTDLETFEIPLPPLPEQHRIVAKLDAVMQKVESNKQRLDKIPKLLKRFRQSVLAAAVSGRLTEDWREKNNFENLFEISEQFSINDTYRDQNELPKNWKWVALGNYVKCNRGRFSIRPRNDPRYFGGSFPFIQIGDLPREGGFVNTHTQTLNELGLKVSKMFPKNTLAIAIVGATIANTGILAYDMCFTDSMVGMNKGDLDLNLFIDYYLRIEKENFRQLSYAGGGQPNIKLELLNAYPFPLPPKEEQKETLRRVEQLFAFADKIEARYTKARAMLDKLPQSILAKAFRGELVAQDPNDEPASVLLERIKAEKEKLAREKKGKKTKTTIVNE
jgi:type I restriction enzyme, S subunit